MVPAQEMINRLATLRGQPHAGYERDTFATRCWSCSKPMREIPVCFINEAIVLCKDHEVGKGMVVAHA